MMYKMVINSVFKMANRFSSRNRVFFGGGSINQMGTMKYREQQKYNITTAKEKIPQKLIIGNT